MGGFLIGSGVACLVAVAAYFAFVSYDAASSAGVEPGSAQVEDTE